MSKHKFEIGDLVKINSVYGKAEAGADQHIGFITRIEDFNGMDKDYFIDGSMSVYFEVELELIAAKSSLR